MVRRPLFHNPRRWFVLAGAGAMVILSAAAAPLRVATFQCDATPPLGEPMIWDTPLKSVQTPLLLKGLVLDDGKQRCVLATLDWCELCNDAELAFRQTLANAANTDGSRVAIHVVHQHMAPYADLQARRLLDAATNPPIHLSDGYLKKLQEQMAQAARASLDRLQPFDRVGLSEVAVERVASHRRLKSETGKILARFSTSGVKPEFANAPEGPIDPKLRTITLAAGEKPLVRLHYYATHPQTFACDGRASSDFVGLARERMEQAEGVAQIYFTGCAGDVTVGKYNDGSARAQSELADRLFAALQQSKAATRFQPADQFAWHSSPVTLPLREDKLPQLAETRARLNDPKAASGARIYSGAMRLAFAQRLERPLTVSGFRLGPATVLHLPGEPMLEFQRYALDQRPQEFLAVAGYFDTGPGYICTDSAFVEGGYEPTASNVGPGSEAKLKAAIREMLNDLSDRRTAHSAPR